MRNRWETYQSYLRSQVKPSAWRDTRLQRLKVLRSRFADALLAVQRGEQQAIFFTHEEAKVFEDAIKLFTSQLPHIVPPSPERDEIIRSIEAIRRTLTRS